MTTSRAAPAKQCDQQSSATASTTKKVNPTSVSTASAGTPSSPAARDAEIEAILEPAGNESLLCIAATMAVWLRADGDIVARDVDGGVLGMALLPCRPDLVVSETTGTMLVVALCVEATVFVWQPLLGGEGSWSQHLVPAGTRVSTAAIGCVWAAVVTGGCVWVFEWTKGSDACWHTVQTASVTMLGWDTTEPSLLWLATAEGPVLVSVDERGAHPHNPMPHPLLPWATGSGPAVHWVAGGNGCVVVASGDHCIVADFLNQTWRRVGGCVVEAAVGKMAFVLLEHGRLTAMSLSGKLEWAVAVQPQARMLTATPHGARLADAHTPVTFFF